MTNSGSLVKGTLAPSPLFSGHVISLSKLMCCSVFRGPSINQTDPLQRTQIPPRVGSVGLTSTLKTAERNVSTFCNKKRKQKKGASKKLNIAQPYMYSHSYFATLQGEK